MKVVIRTDDEDTEINTENIKVYAKVGDEKYSLEEMNLINNPCCVYFVVEFDNGKINIYRKWMEIIKYGKTKYEHIEMSINTRINVKRRTVNV